MPDHTYQDSWTEDDFESMSWHDNTVHGLRLRNPNTDYDSELVLDIDYIVEWICQVGRNTCRFAVAPAELTFVCVSNLRIDVHLVLMESLIIDGIEREEITTEDEARRGHRRYRWTISMHSFEQRANKIVIESSGFRQVLKKPPVITMNQDLDEDDR